MIKLQTLFRPHGVTLIGLSGFQTSSTNPNLNHRWASQGVKEGPTEED